MFRITKIIVFFVSLLLSGCTSLTFKKDSSWKEGQLVNQNTTEYIYEKTILSNRTESGEKLHLILSLSGEGAKGSAFSYGILEALNDVKSTTRDRSLLQEVDVISAVSGAGGVALSYGLHAEKIFDKNDKLYSTMMYPTRWNAGPSAFVLDQIGFKLIYAFLNQWFGKHYLVPDFVADYFSEVTYGGDSYGKHGATYGDLIEEIRRRNGAFILISATDLVKGRRFEFSQPQFDLLCSNLSKLQIGRVVTASTIPPILTSGIRLRNFSANHCRPYIIEAISDKSNKNNPYLMQKNGNSPIRNAYVHLADGSLSDNLALGSIIAGMERWSTAWSLKRMLYNNPPEKVLIIGASIKNRLPKDTDYNLRLPDSVNQIYPILSLATTHNSIDSLKYAELKFRTEIDLLKETGKLNSNLFEFYETVMVSPNDLLNQDVPNCLEQLEIQLDTINEDLADIALIAKKALYTNIYFKEFIRENGWQLPQKQEFKDEGEYRGQCGEK